MNILQEVLKPVHKDWLPYFQADGSKIIHILEETLKEVSKTKNKCPDHPSKILKCFDISPKDLRVVIVNQGVYTEPGVATGYALGLDAEPYQPSLNMLVRDLRIYSGDSSLGIETPFDYTLKSWRDQGIMLLNIGLTAESFAPGSHLDLWFNFQTEIFKVLNDLKITEKDFQSLYFVFLGATTQTYEPLINENLHYKILEKHPLKEGIFSFFNKIENIKWT